MNCKEFGSNHNLMRVLSQHSSGGTEENYESFIQNRQWPGRDSDEYALVPLPQSAW